jgi:NADH-quinone oxidoreductase subunit N
VAELPFLTPLTVLACGSVLLLVMGLFLEGTWPIKITYALVLVVTWLFTSAEEGVLFEGFITLDTLAYKMSRILLMLAFFALFFRGPSRHYHEFFFLVLALLIASILMSVSTHFLLVYLAIELASYSAYFITGLKFSASSSEASFKYILFGSVATAIMLFGISLIYAAGGGLTFLDVQSGPVSMVGVTLFMAGIFYKLSIVPLHIWAPSSYQSALCRGVAMLATLPKLGAFVLFYHFYKVMQPDIQAFLQTLVLTVSITSIVFGTVAAINQQDIKRLIAYGAIAHSGLMFPLVMLDNREAFIFYALIYGLMTVAIFYFISIHEHREDNTSLIQYEGVGVNYAWLGVTGTVLVVSLIGLPPTAGFTAKLMIFASAWEHYTQNGDALWFTFFLVGILSTLISVYFYLQLPYHYFLKNIGKHTLVPQKYGWITATFFALLLLWIFIQPQILNSFV